MKRLPKNPAITKLKLEKFVKMTPKQLNSIHGGNNEDPPEEERPWKT